MSISSLGENPLDLSIAGIMQNTDTQFLVVSVITAGRMIIAEIAGVIALYFSWRMKRDFAPVCSRTKIGRWSTKPSRTRPLHPFTLWTLRTLQDVAKFGAHGAPYFF